MNHKKYIGFVILFVAGMVLSCVDESKFPLPYNDRTVAAYLRMYKITSNIFDLTDIAGNAGAATAFETVFEPVDEANGDNTASIEFYVSHRRGPSLTAEVLVKIVDASVFAAVAEPTYSAYKRATIRVTYAETQAALLTVSADPDGAGPCTNCAPASGLAGYPGSLIAADLLVYRWVQVLKDGRRFTVFNPQQTVNPAFGNPTEENSTANITTGQYYGSPYTFTITVRSQLAGSWVGPYALTQAAIWSPAHSWDLHAAYPAYMKEVLFPDQTVTLSIPASGLSTEREFSVQYRGQTTTMRINLENGAVFVPQINTGITCTTERQLYWCTPTTGNFTKPATSTVNLVAPLPTATVANRGAYTTTLTGLVAGQQISIGVDDDCDEYGRRNGYCTWTRRVRLVLTR